MFLNKRVKQVLTYGFQFRPDMPKLLFVGIIERTCRATIVREIPGITDCFQTKEDSKTGGEPTVKVGHGLLVSFY